MIITVNYKDCKLEIDVLEYHDVKPDDLADNPDDYYGYTDIDFNIKSITSMAYDEDGNQIKEITIDYPQDVSVEDEDVFLDSLWNKYGIDVIIDFDELYRIVCSELANTLT